MMTKTDKKTVTVVVGQRVYCMLYGGKYGIVVGVDGQHAPQTVGSIGGFITTGGNAWFTIAFENHISKCPESIVRGVQWEIFEEVATSDEVIDAVTNAKAQQELAKLQEQVAAERRELERKEHANNPAYAHLDKRSDKPQWSNGRLAASNIRKELKRRFPKTTFKVTSDHNTVNLSWENGPSADQVKAITRRHKDTDFDSMSDCSQHNANATFASVFGGVTYIFESRKVTPDMVRKCFSEAYPNGLTVDGKTYHGNTLPDNWQGIGNSSTAIHFISNTFNDKDLS